MGWVAVFVGKRGGLDGYFVSRRVLDRGCSLVNVGSGLYRACVVDWDGR
jgi:hypothetical protein